MKTQLPLLLIFFLFLGQLQAQTTEAFEDESIGSATFTDNGQQFQIAGTPPATFDVYQFNGGGWSGTGVDNRFIDNSGTTFFNLPVDFSISTVGGAPFTLKSMYLCLAKSDVTLIVTGSVTITGRLDGNQVFSVTTNGPYNTSWTIQNGFTFFDMTTLGGSNNSNTVIDSFSITTTGNIAYVALDAMTWQCGAPTIEQASQTNVSCNGGANGAATVSASPGVTYDWTPGNPAGDGTATVTGLTAGVWICTVTTGCGLSSSTSFTIEEPEALTAVSSQTRISCAGGSNGTASVEVTGGAGGYTYSWSPSGGTGATATGLSAGNYTVTITDANDCSIQEEFTITEPEAIIINNQPEDAIAAFGATATFAISATNVVGYQWQISANGTDWDAIVDGGTQPSYAGSSTNTLTVAGVTTVLDGFSFRVVVTNDSDCEMLSEIATLFVADGLVAVDDDFSEVVITEGQGGIAGDVTANDLFNGASVDDETITITLIDNGGLAGATINEEGELAVPTTATEGTYALTYTICELADTDNCSDAIVTVVVQPDLAVSDPKLVAARLYPNPARTEVFVQISNDTDGNDAVVRIYDLSGRRLLEQPISKSLHRIDIASLPAGVYLFDIAFPSGKVTQKIIKQ